MDWWLLFACIPLGFFFSGVGCCCGGTSTGFCGECSFELTGGTWSVTVSGVTTGTCDPTECNKLNATFVPAYLGTCTWGPTNFFSFPFCPGYTLDQSRMELSASPAPDFRFHIFDSAIGGTTYEWRLTSNTDPDCERTDIPLAYYASPASFPGSSCDSTLSTCLATYVP